ncbi:MAG: YdbL family protein [Spirochaetes bacterium]|nr:YdbL family protein [Spirochaetota bacterium]
MRFPLKNLFFSIFVLSMFSGCKSGESSRPACCLFIPPPITMTGEKTAIEKQIIGDYRELEKDAWIVSSVNTNVNRGDEKSGAAGGDMILLKAMKVREFHETRIRQYKDEGAIGEAGNGLIAYRGAPRYDSDKELKQILSTIMEEENKARLTIFERSLAKSGSAKPSEEDVTAFGKIFAEEQRALAKKNDWIQENSGNWVRKK